MGSRARTNEIRWRGVAASPGIAVGPAHVFSAARAEPPKRFLASDVDPTDEHRRFDDAIESVRGELKKLKKTAPGSVGSAVAKIFDAQLLLLDDPTIHEDVKRVISTERLSAESAFGRAVGAAQSAISRSDDPYLREMSNDIQTVKQRVINRLLGLSNGKLQSLNRSVVLLADTINPADILSLNQRHIMALIIESGGATSHAALIAKSLGIPAVMGVGHDVREVAVGTMLVVDGYSGVVIINPEPDTVEFFERKRKRTHRPWPKRLDALRDQPAITRDRHRLRVMANIDLCGEASLAVASGADAVGLFRTEYLFLQRGGYPSEARQRSVYGQAVALLEGRPLIVRTFDLGSDKALPGSRTEINPALGLRGVRVSLARPHTLVTQFRALLEVSTDGEVWVMVPMVSDVTEFVAVKQLWADAKRMLSHKSIPFDAKTRLGLMIETPAAIRLADELAHEADFISIGTNDLSQYTMAVDRGNTQMTSWHHHWHPALWRQLADAVAAARRARIPVSICGEMAADLLALPALVGLRVDSLSAHPHSLPRMKELIRSLRFADCRTLVKKVLSMATSEDVQKSLRQFQKKYANTKSRR